MLKVKQQLPSVKIFGLPRVGTNYARYLLENNYIVNVLVDRGGWKHGYISPALHPKRRCIMLCKNPYSWLRSAFNYYSQPHGEVVSVNIDSFDSFLRSEFTLAHLGMILAFANPIECWGQMNRHWLHIPLTERSLSLVRYEDLLADPQKVIAMLAARWKLASKSNIFNTPIGLLVPTKDEEEMVEDESEFDKTYYTEERYLSVYTQEQISLVKSKIDVGIVKRLQYSL